VPDVGSPTGRMRPVVGDGDGWKWESVEDGGEGRFGWEEMAPGNCSGGLGGEFKTGWWVTRLGSPAGEGAEGCATGLSSVPQTGPSLFVSAEGFTPVLVVVDCPPGFVQG
jgi:hypothetical protein